MSRTVARIAGAVLIIAGLGLILGRRTLGTLALRLRGEPYVERGEARGYGAAFMVAGDIMIAVGALLLLGIVPQPR
jgi:hypothetical protein